MNVRERRKARRLRRWFAAHAVVVPPSWTSLRRLERLWLRNVWREAEELQRLFGGESA